MNIVTYLCGGINALTDEECKGWRETVKPYFNDMMSAQDKDGYYFLRPGKCRSKSFESLEALDKAYQNFEPIFKELKMETPESIKHHQPDYIENIWQNYSIQELGWWVALFVKRASHRTKREKAEKDLHDAQNYLNMMQAHVDNAKEHMGE